MDEKGTYIKTYDVFVKNTSEKIITVLHLPARAYDIYNHTDDEFEELLELSVNGAKKDITLEAIRPLKRTIKGITTGILTLSKNSIEVVYKIPVRIEPEQSAHIILKLKTLYSLENMFDYEAVGVRIDAVMENYELRIIPPKGRKIKLHTSAELPNAFTVQSLSLNMENPDLVQLVEGPSASSDNRSVSWHVVKPKLGFMYSTSFKIY